MVLLCPSTEGRKVYLLFITSKYCLTKFGIHNRQQLVARLSSDDSDAFVGELIQQIREEQPSPQLVECFLENIVLVMPDHARLALVKKLISEEVKHTGTV